MDVWPKSILEVALSHGADQGMRIYTKACVMADIALSKKQLLGVNPKEIGHAALLAKVVQEGDNRSLETLASEQITLAIRDVLRERFIAKRTVPYQDDIVRTNTGDSVERQRNPVAAISVAEFQARLHAQLDVQEFSEQEDQIYEARVRGKAAEIETKRSLCHAIVRERRSDFQRNINPILDALEHDPPTYIHPPDEESGIYVIREKLCPDLGISDDEYSGRIRRFREVLKAGGLSFEELLFDMLILHALKSRSATEE